MWEEGESLDQEGRGEWKDRRREREREMGDGGCVCVCVKGWMDLLDDIKLMEVARNTLCPSHLTH